MRLSEANFTLEILFSYIFFFVCFYFLLIPSLHAALFPQQQENLF